MYICHKRKEKKPLSEFSFFFLRKIEKDSPSNECAHIGVEAAVSAICVQRFDDSLSPAIHITYRISLRSSSLREPRYPLLRVVFFLLLFQKVFSKEKTTWKRKRIPNPLEKIYKIISKKGTDFFVFVLNFIFLEKSDSSQRLFLKRKKNRFSLFFCLWLERRII